MKLLQEKSVCCGVKIIRFGGKRRQCTACRKTWRVHPASRGRKALRGSTHYLEKVFCARLSVKQLSIHSKLSEASIYKRFNKSLNASVGKKRIIHISGKKLILIIDAQWKYFQGKLWTLYFLALKSTDSKKVKILDPVLSIGKESARNWNEIIEALPSSVKNRIVALVSDGIRGIETISDDHEWIIQRCHFHLLSPLQKRRGKRASTPGRLVRERIYCLVKQALKETSFSKLDSICKELAWLAKHPRCPKSMKMIVRDFLRRLSEFRSFLEYPDLQLPTTTNVMESINSMVVYITRSVNTPGSWHKWATACIRAKSIFTCE